MNVLAVVTPPSIYCVCSTWKAFWREIFTPVDMKNCGHRNVRKHGKLKYGEKYITLDVSLNFDSLDKMKITSSETKECLGILGKCFIAYLDINTIRRSNKNKKARCAINNLRLKYSYNIIKEFEKFPYEGYVQKR